MGRQKRLKRARRIAVRELTPEQRAAAQLTEERNRRVRECHAAIVAQLQRSGCGFDVALTLAMTPGSTVLQGRYQLNVIPLDGSSEAVPIAPPADPAASSSSKAGS